jgi:hypothetical protein
MEGQYFGYQLHSAAGETPQNAGRKNQIFFELIPNILKQKINKKSSIKKNRRIY